jgi:ABC-2 type transport system permease protein
LIAGFYVGVTLSLASWGIILLLVTVTSIPLMIFGVTLAFCGSNAVVNLMVNLIVFPVAILSGLWWPLSMMPNWGQKIGKLLPTYQTSVIVNDVINHISVPLKAIGGEFVWLVLAASLLIIVQKIQRMQATK